jgi:hypothetical protein
LPLPGVLAEPVNDNLAIKQQVVDGSMRRQELSSLKENLVALNP